MNMNKTCPACETEYMPHIEKCADCGATLLRHEEYVAARRNKRRLAETTVINAVAVREGDLKWLEELHSVLSDSGIPSAVTSVEGCKKGC